MGLGGLEGRWCLKMRDGLLLVVWCGVVWMGPRRPEGHADRYLRFSPLSMRGRQREV